ncbi:hypothetical protein CBM15_15950 [Solibacillus kalamii]|uniref:Uncharacterized protein n=1 Tax=Solibacillus kalamii TaxID=1748298 RepID=A0ABX3ZDM1_9BACL|nr:hypothetical protein CBM15_15950 [Solibacillus kalamii]
MFGERALAFLAGAFLCGGGVSFIRRLGWVIRRFLDDIRGNGWDIRSTVNWRGREVEFAGVGS